MTYRCRPIHHDSVPSLVSTMTWRPHGSCDVHACTRHDRIRESALRRNITGADDISRSVGPIVRALVVRTREVPRPEGGASRVRPHPGRDLPPNRNRARARLRSECRARADSGFLPTLSAQPDAPGTPCSPSLGKPTCCSSQQARYARRPCSSSVGQSATPGTLTGLCSSLRHHQRSSAAVAGAPGQIICAALTP